MGLGALVLGEGREPSGQQDKDPAQEALPKQRGVTLNLQFSFSGTGSSAGRTADGDLRPKHSNGRTWKYHLASHGAFAAKGR